MGSAADRVMSRLGPGLGKVRQAMVFLMLHPRRLCVQHVPYLRRKTDQTPPRHPSESPETIPVCCETEPPVPETETPCLIIPGKPRDVTHTNLTGLPALAIAVALVLPDLTQTGRPRLQSKKSKAQASNELKTKSPPTRLLHDSTTHFPPRPPSREKKNRRPSLPFFSHTTHSPSGFLPFGENPSEDPLQATSTQQPASNPNPSRIDPI